MSRVSALFYPQSCMCTSSSANSLLKWRMNTPDWASLGGSQARLTRLLMLPHNPTSPLTRGLFSTKGRTGGNGIHTSTHLSARSTRAIILWLHYSYYHANSSNLAVLIGGLTHSLSQCLFLCSFFFFCQCINKSLTLRKSFVLERQQKHLRIHKLVLLSWCNYHTAQCLFKLIWLI